MASATAEEIAELLGERADDDTVERIANLGVSLDEVSEALDDLDYQLRFGDTRDASSPKVDQIRTILEELPALEDAPPPAPDEDEDEHEHAGLRVVEPDELGNERT